MAAKAVSFLVLALLLLAVAFPVVSSLARPVPSAISRSVRAARSWPGGSPTNRSVSSALSPAGGGGRRRQRQRERLRQRERQWQRQRQRRRQPEAVGVLAQVRVAVLQHAVQESLPHLLQQVLRQVPLRAPGLLRQQGRLPLLQQLEDQGGRAQVPLDQIRDQIPAAIALLWWPPLSGSTGLLADDPCTVRVPFSSLAARCVSHALFAESGMLAIPSRSGCCIMCC
jgi:hypothetical protein